MKIWQNQSLPGAITDNILSQKLPRIQFLAFLTLWYKIRIALHAIILVNQQIKNHTLWPRS
jgi:hypothetical protein